MLVSARSDAGLRTAVARGERPCPEFLRLERDHAVELLDWSRLPRSLDRRSHLQALQHVVAAIQRLGRFEVVFSDGEHVGIPLALTMQALVRYVPHLMIGHHLTARAKPQILRLVRGRAISRILVHSTHQLSLAQRRLQISTERLTFLPYYADESFWRPAAVPEEALIVSAGREHRDYRTLARACAGLSERVFIAAGSRYSPRARCLMPDGPAGLEVGFLEHRSLRALYGRASLVVIPLVPNDFQGGVTTLLEAMAMGKAVVISATEGQGDIVRDGETGVTVPAGDAEALAQAVRRLLADPRERRRLGRNAREAVEMEFSLDMYAERLAGQLQDIARASSVAV